MNPRLIVNGLQKHFFACLALLWLAACGEAEKPASPPSAAPLPPAVSSPAPKQVSAPPAKTTDTPLRGAGTVVKATALREKPYLDARVLEVLAPKTPVAVFERHGGWLRVEARGRTGWVRLLDVSTVAAAGQRPGADVEAVAGLATGRAGTGNIVATSGIRGLTPEQLQRAQPDRAELARLERYGIDKDEAAAYARRHGLAARALGYLSAPGGE
jgi:glucose/arabinose dehydrogenase